MAKRSKLVRKSELAKHLRLSKGRISQLIKEGMPVRKDGLLNLDRAIAWYEREHPRRRLAGKRKPLPATKGKKPARASQRSDDEGARYALARAEREEHQAKLKALELQTRTGKLVDADKVRLAFVRISGQIRESLSGIPDRIAALVAADTDEAAVHEIMAAEIHRTLENLSEGLRID